jgi:hypothetical protein
MTEPPPHKRRRTRAEGAAASPPPHPVAPLLNLLATARGRGAPRPLEWLQPLADFAGADERCSCALALADGRAAHGGGALFSRPYNPFGTNRCRSLLMSTGPPPTMPPQSTHQRQARQALQWFMEAVALEVWKAARALPLPPPEDFEVLLMQQEAPHPAQAAQVQVYIKRGGGAGGGKEGEMIIYETVAAVGKRRRGRRREETQVLNLDADALKVLSHLTHYRWKMRLTLRYRDEEDLLRPLLGPNGDATLRVMEVPFLMKSWDNNTLMGWSIAPLTLGVVDHYTHARTHHTLDRRPTTALQIIP